MVVESPSDAWVATTAGDGNGLLPADGGCAGYDFAGCKPAVRQTR